MSPSGRTRLTVPVCACSDDTGVNLQHLADMLYGRYLQRRRGSQKDS